MGPADRSKWSLGSRGYARPVPVDVAQKPPEPLLDAGGMQRYDPEGRPMFAPTVYQLRDKKGKPVVDADGKPVFQTQDNLGYDARGREIKPPKQVNVKAPKKTVLVEHGSLAINGIVGKVRLNYTIDNMQYLYLYSPEIGVTVVSDQPFPGSRMQADAFRGNTLSVKVDGKLLQLSSDAPLLGTRPKPAYVAVDRSFMLHENFPVFGYGAIDRPPYSWPGARRDDAYVSKDAPKLIEGLKPKLEDGSAGVAAPPPAGASTKASTP